MPKDEWLTTRSMRREPDDIGIDNPYLDGGGDGLGSYPANGDPTDMTTGCAVDGGPIPCEIIGKVISRNQDRFAYAFMGETYAVTIDRGNTWKLWNADTELKDRVHVHSRSIKTVSIATNGTGSMNLYENPFEQGPPPVLRTQAQILRLSSFLRGEPMFALLSRLDPKHSIHQDFMVVRIRCFC